MIVVIASIIFGLFHFFTLSYVLYNMIAGGLFVYAYVVKQDKGGYYGYWTTAILHGLTNTTTLILWQFEYLLN